jgi:hypothetical protein
MIIAKVVIVLFGLDLIQFSVNLCKSSAFKSVNPDEKKKSVVSDMPGKINAWELLRTHQFYEYENRNENVEY